MIADAVFVRFCLVLGNAMIIHLFTVGASPE